MNVLARIGIALLMGLTLPLYYFLIVIDGFMPWFAILTIALLPEWQLGYYGLIVNSVQLLVYAALLWWLASILLRVLRTIDDQRWRVFAGISVVGALLAMGCLPVYSLGHSRGDGQSAIELYSNLFRDHDI